MNALYAYKVSARRPDSDRPHTVVDILDESPADALAQAKLAIPHDEKTQFLVALCHDYNQ